MLFICILAVSSVVNKTIFTFYPDFGDVKYKLLFTQEVKPRLGSSKGVVNKVGHFNPVLRSHPIISSHMFLLVESPKNRKSCSNGVQ